jgi:hypothetical protein
MEIRNAEAGGRYLQRWRLKKISPKMEIEEVSLGMREHLSRESRREERGQEIGSVSGVDSEG